MLSLSSSAFGRTSATSPLLTVSTVRAVEHPPATAIAAAAIIAARAEYLIIGLSFKKTSGSVASGVPIWGGTANNRGAVFG
jgi:hypothetical protein